MTSKIRITVGGHYEIDVTGSVLSPGHRISAGSGEDYDTGTVDRIDGKKITVRWDSGVVTTIPSSQVRVII